MSLINRLIQNLTTFANEGGDDVKKAIFDMGFFSLVVTDRHTPHGLSIETIAQGYLADMPEELQEALAFGEYDRNQGFESFTTRIDSGPIKTVIVGVLK